MRKIWLALISTLSLGLLMAGFAYAQVNNNLWTQIGAFLRPVNLQLGIQIGTNQQFSVDKSGNGTTTNFSVTSLTSGNCLQAAGGGKITTASGPCGSGGGSLSGGTRGYVATWASSTALTIGTLIDNGTVAGQNATSSTVSFNIQSAAGLTPLVVASSTGSALVTIAGNGSTTLSSLATAGSVYTTAGGSLYVNGTTGTGLAVQQTSPTLITPILGTASGTALSISNNLFVTGTSTLATVTTPTLLVSGLVSCPNLQTSSIGLFSCNNTSYLTGNQTITLSGAVTGSGATSIATVFNPTAFATGTTGTNFNIATTTTSLTINLPNASASNNGQLLAADWTTFNNKLGTTNVSGASGQNAFFAGTNTVNGSANYLWNNTSNTQTITGTSTVSNAIAIGAISFAAPFIPGQTRLAIQGSNTNFIESNIQNTNNGTVASSDYVLTADNGNATTYYADLFQNSSGFTNTGGVSGGAGDAGLISSDRSLYLGTASSTNASANIYFVAQNNNVATITKTSLTFATTTINGTLAVTGVPTLSGVLNCNGSTFLQITSGLFGCGTPAGGGGSVSGGITGYVATWASSTGLTTGILKDNGTVAGVNATSSLNSFNIQGTGTLNPLNVASSSGTSLFLIGPNGSTTLSSLATGVVRSNSGSLFNGQVNLTSDVSGVLPIVNGGTASSTLFSSGLQGQFLGNSATGVTGWFIPFVITVCPSTQTGCNYTASSTNPASTINSAITAANNLSIGSAIVHVRAGTYVFASNTNLSLLNNVILEGEGDATQFMRTATSTDFIQTNGKSNVILRDFLVSDSNDAGALAINGASLMYIQDSNNIKSDHVDISNANGFGYYLPSSSGHSNTNITITNGFLQCNGFQDCIGGGPFVQGNSTTSDITISNMHTIQTVGNGSLGNTVDPNCIDITGGFDIIYSNNTCYGHVTLGFEKVPNSNSIITGNTIHPPLGATNIAGELLILQNHNTNVPASSTPIGLVISGNTLTGGDIQFTGNSTSSIDGAIVTNNNVTAAPSGYQTQDGLPVNGMHFDYFKNGTVSNNKVYSATGAVVAGTTGIQFTSNTSGNNITGNIVQGFVNGFDGSNVASNIFNGNYPTNNTNPYTNTQSILQMNSSGQVSIGTGTLSSAAALTVLGSSASGLGAIIQAGNTLGIKLGADINANTITSGVTRKLARMVMPAWDAGGTNVFLFSGDLAANGSASDLYFGGTPGGSQYAMTGLHFVTGSATTTTGGISAMDIDNLGNIKVATLTANSLVKTDASNNLQAVTLGTNLSFSGNTLNASGGGGSSPISTSTPAQTGKSVIWTGSATLGNGVVFDNATVAGVNATSSTVSFNIQGSTILDPLNVASSSGTSYLRVTSLGRVGIGSSTPLDLFDVASTTGAGILTVSPQGTVGINVKPNTLASNVFLEVDDFSGDSIQFKPGNPSSIQTANCSEIDLWSVHASCNGTTIIEGATFSNNNDVGLNTLHSINSTGNVGINTTTPSFGFVNVGTAQFKGLTTSSGTQTASICGDANGQLISDSGVCIVSAARFKFNVNPLDTGLGELMKLNPVDFYYKPEFNGALQTNPNYNGEQVGFIADDVQKTDPRLVTVETATSTNGSIVSTPGEAHSVRYDNMVALVVKAVQEQQKEITNLPAYKNARRNVEENGQWIVIGLLVLGFGYQQRQIKKLKKKVLSNN